jgi:hypothetical protein
MLDLRIPTGAFFAMIGAILLGLAFFGHDISADLTDANVNLYCGSVMLAFGGVMLTLAWRGRS